MVKTAPGAGETRVKILLNIPATLKAALKARSERYGQPVNWLIVQAVREYLEREARK